MTSRKRLSPQAFAIGADGRQQQGHLRGAGGLGDRAQGMGCVAADELLRAVDDHLRCVVVVEVKALGVVGPGGR